MLTIYERTPTAKQLGERLRLTNAERERLVRGIDGLGGNLRKKASIEVVSL